MEVRRCIFTTGMHLTQIEATRTAPVCDTVACCKNFLSTVKSTATLLSCVDFLALGKSWVSHSSPGIL
jgi:hypothetical protein